AACVPKIAASSAVSNCCVAVKFGVDVTTAIGVLGGPGVRVAVGRVVGCAACVPTTAASSAASNCCVAVKFGVDVTTAIGVLSGPGVYVALGVGLGSGVAEGAAV